MFQWIALFFTLTGPLQCIDTDYVEICPIRAGINASFKFDCDGDNDLDLKDIACFQNDFDYWVDH